MTSDPWFADDDPQSLPKRVARVLERVTSNLEAPCGGCGAALCGHAVVFSIVSGHEDRPRCLSCIAAEEGRDASTMRDEMALFAQSKPCLTQGWRLSSLREGFGAEDLPSCHWADGEGARATREEEEASAEVEGLPFDEHFDAGDQSCGELLMVLRKRINALAGGAVMRLTATDSSAPRDIPSWCRLTGHALEAARHPDYFIRRKEDR